MSLGPGWMAREQRKKDGLLLMVGIMQIDSAESHGVMRQGKMSFAAAGKSNVSSVKPGLWKYDKINNHISNTSSIGSMVVVTASSQHGSSSSVP